MTTSAALSVAPTSSTARKTKAMRVSMSMAGAALAAAASCGGGWVVASVVMGCLLRGRDGSEGRDSGWLGASGAPPSCHQPAGRVRLVRGAWPAFGRPYTRWVVLLGRTAEQEAVARLLAAARLGRGGVLVVTGEPGIGKTAQIGRAHV